MKTALSLALLMLAVNAPSAVAQEEPTVSARLSVPDTLLIGQRVGLDIVVEHDAGDRLTLPDSIDVEPFEILSVADSTAPATEGRVDTHLSVVLAAFDVGNVTLPPLPMLLQGSDGSLDTLRTDPFDIEVQSVGLDQSGDIRGIKPPWSIGRNWLLLAPWIVAFAALAGALWWYLKHRKRVPGEPVAPTAPLRSAHEIAFEELTRLADAELIERGKIKEFYIRLSDIVRVYLLGRWQIDAVDMTSGEALALLREADIESVEWNRCADILRRCDMVKFAKHIPDRADSDGMIPLAQEFVHATRHRPPPAPSEEAA